MNSSPVRSGRPPGVRLPRLEPPPPPCVRVVWSWPRLLWAWDHNEATGSQVTLTLYADGQPIRRESREHVGPLSDLRWVMVMRRGEFFNRTVVAEMAGNGWSRTDSVPGTALEVECGEESNG